MYYRHHATKYIRIFFQVNRHYNRITLAVPLIFMEMQSIKKRDRTNENFVPTTRRLCAEISAVTIIILPRTRYSQEQFLILSAPFPASNGSHDTVYPLAVRLSPTYCRFAHFGAPAAFCLSRAAHSLHFEAHFEAS